MKNPNTPKQTVEAKINELWDKAYDLIDFGVNLDRMDYQYEEKAKKLFTQYAMALLNPVEKDKKLFCVCGHLKADHGSEHNDICFHCPCGLQAPSPNEAPKCYCKCHDVPRNWKLTCSCNCQPPPPDKGWEELYTTVAIFLDNLNIRDDFPIIVTHKTYKVNDLDSLMKIFLDWLKKHDKALPLSKDQEADRRVEKVIGEIEKHMFFEPINEFDDNLWATLNLTKEDWEALKKKLSSK